MKSHVVSGVESGHKEKSTQCAFPFREKSEILAPELYVSGAESNSCFPLRSAMYLEASSPAKYTSQNTYTTYKQRACSS